MRRIFVIAVLLGGSAAMVAAPTQEIRAGVLGVTLIVLFTTFPMEN